MEKLTVVMPVHNGEKFLEETLDSLLNQTFRDFKVLIFDDNSSDSTPKILEKYKSKDLRFIIHTKKSNHGPAHLRNEGFDLANSEYIALLDADDIAESTRFEKQVAYLDQNPEVGVCGSWFTIFGDKKDKVLKHATTHEAIKIQFLKSCAIGNSTVMLRKAVLGNLRFEDQFVPAEDYGLWTQLVQKCQFHNIPESLVRYRWHPGNISQTKEENLRKSEVLIKKRQLEQLNITPKNLDIEYYVHAISLKRKLSPEQIIKTIAAAKDCKNRNNSLQIYQKDLFDKHIDKVVLRTLRNAESFNKKLFHFIKKESGYFSKMNPIDRLIFILKCWF